MGFCPFSVLEDDGIPALPAARRPPGQADRMTLVQVIESIRVRILDPILDEHCNAYRYPESGIHKAARQIH